MTTTLEMPGTTRSPDGPCRVGPSRGPSSRAVGPPNGEPPVSHDTRSLPISHSSLPGTGVRRDPDGHLQGTGGSTPTDAERAGAGVATRPRPCRQPVQSVYVNVGGANGSPHPTSIAD